MHVDSQRKLAHIHFEDQDQSIAVGQRLMVYRSELGGFQYRNSPLKSTKRFADQPMSVPLTNRRFPKLPAVLHVVAIPSDDGSQVAKARGGSSDQGQVHFTTQPRGDKASPVQGAKVALGRISRQANYGSSEQHSVATRAAFAAVNGDTAVSRTCSMLR